MSPKVTLSEAAERIGDKVIYLSGHTPAEEGVITSVNDRFVFVRYGSQTTSAATHPSMLRFLSVRDPE